MHQLPREIGGLVPWVPSARWYPAKGAAGAVSVWDAVKLPTPDGMDPAPSAAWLAIVEADGDAAWRFVLPLEQRVGADADGPLADAAVSPAFAAWLLTTVLRGEAVEGASGSFQGRVVAPAIIRARPTPPPVDPACVRVVTIGGDASNTSLAVAWGDTRVVVKLLRRCREGFHPEVEVGEFLATSPVAADVPRLLGWLEYAPHGGGRERGTAVLATVHEQVDAAGSAWDAMLGLALSDWPRCRGLAVSLGETTARLHAAFACRRDVPAFAAEPWTADAWATATRRMGEHAAAVVSKLADRRAALSPEDRATTDRLLARRAALLGRFAEASAPPAGAARIRVHGDYHLGQVLVSWEGDRCTVIDFEGEPARSLDERRERTSAAKDVAGMCRSFDYLLRVLAKQGQRAYRAEDVRDLEVGFVSAYEAASRRLSSQGGGGVRWWPEERSEADRLLAIFMLDKAVYELAYEADNRPDWIDVPLGAVASLIDRR
jgi:maltose alpha-D-glucosyltransferase/alpha-amylase